MFTGLCIGLIIIITIYFTAKALFFDDGYISYEILAGRSGQKLHIDNVDESITDCVLSIICEAFDINPDDKDKIREQDSVKAIYDSWYKINFLNMDDCELERFFGMLQRLINQEIDNSEAEKYTKMGIGEMIALAARIRNNQPVSDSEKENILDGQADLF